MCCFTLDFASNTGLDRNQLEMCVIERVLKLLSLSSSENDHEALSAIRSANSFLKKNGYQWRDFISPKEYKNKLYSRYCNGIIKGTKNKGIHRQVNSIHARVVSNKSISTGDWRTLKALYDMVVNKKKSESGFPTSEKG